MKKIVSLIMVTALILCAVFTMTSCSKTNYIGVQTGTTAEYFVNGSDDFPGIDNYTAKKYTTFPLAVQDMKNGAVPYVIVDNKTGESLVSEIKGIKTIDIALATEEYGIAVNKDDADLLADINAVLKDLKDSGKLAEILEMNDDDFTRVTSATFDADKADKQLVVATNAEFPPFESKDGDKFIGIDIEIAKHIADKLELELVIKDMDFDSVVTSVGKNGVDIGMSGLTINNARKKSVNFSDPYFSDSSLVVLVLESETAFDNCKTKDDVLAVLAENAK